MICLAACIALQMTSFVIILPLFARRFSEFGAGVAELGTSEIAYALAATVCAPLMGALADRIGRRPVVLVGLAVYVLAFTGYLFAYSATAFIIIRGLAGALTAGLIPAATGMVADLAPADRRAQWIGVLSGGASFGWIAGPILGGVLFDNWGYSTALEVSIVVAAAALLIALLGVQETRSRAGLGEVQPAEIEAPPRRTDLRASLLFSRASLPASLGTLSLVLFIYLSVMFAWAFVEPRFMFYAYDDLGWSSSTVGFLMSTYGLALMISEFGLGNLSDRLGRRPVIVVGLALFLAQFAGMAFARDRGLVAASFIIAGFGNGLYDPALSASILDVTPAAHRARMLGLKATFGSIGSILGPALAVASTPLMPPQGTFTLATGLVLAVAVLTVVAWQAPSGRQSGPRRRRLETKVS